MRDKKLEYQITQLESFITLWKKFYDLFNKARTGQLTPQDETDFFEIKTSLAKNYNVILASLGLEDDKDSKGLEILTQFVNLQDAQNVTDGIARRIASIWNSKYIDFEKILGELENNRAELARINPVTLYIKKALWNPVTIILYLIVLIFLAFMGFNAIKQHYMPPA